MQGGFSLQDAMKILRSDANRIVFEEIDARLMNGESIDSFIRQFCPKEISAYLEGFMLYMSFPDALAAALSVVKEERKERSVLIKGCLYPCVLLAGMLGGIFLFASFVLPVMLSLMDSLAIDEAGGYETLRVLIRIGSAVLMILFVIVIVFSIYAFHKKHIARTYLIAARRFPDCLLVRMATRDFIRFFCECAKRNVSTYETLHMLSKIDEKPLVSLIAAILDASLLNGESLETAMRTSPIEPALIRFVHIAASTGRCAEMLDGYLIMCTKRTEASIRRFSRNVQLFSYTLIGIVLIFVYSVLMLPMSMLSRI